MVQFTAWRPDPSRPDQPAPPSEQGDPVQSQPDLEEMTSTLAAQGIESNELALDLILHDLAEQARQATDAAGAAIALQRDRDMVCRAAAGAVAPDLGVAINTESGLTGACVREQKTQWCSDTETDPRVDPEACRALGVRSIVVVPVFRKDALVGVFEIFSSEPEAFREHHLKSLQGLAQWVTEAMQSSAGKTAIRQATELVVDSVTRPGIEVPARTPAEVVPISQSLEPPPADKETKVLRAVVIGLAIILVLMLGIHWGWKRTNQPAQVRMPTPDASHAAPQQPEEITLQGGQNPGSAKPQASKGAPGQQNNKESLVVYQDGNVVFRQPDGSSKKRDTAANDQPAKAESAPSNSAADTEKTQAAAQTESKLDIATPEIPPPQATTTAGLLAMVPPSAVPVVPVAPDVRISKGLTEGKLINRVNPVYPSQALQRRIDGQVVIQAQVGKDGRVHKPKVIRGNALLVSAALDAVRQWTYEPYRLNGEPVDMDTQITINFKLP
jgi:TonB family protein